MNTMNLITDKQYFEHTAEYLFSGIPNVTGADHEAFLIIGVITIQWVLLYFLYKKRIFLRV